MSKVSFGIRTASALAAIFLLAACETTPDRDVSGSGAGAAGASGSGNTVSSGSVSSLPAGVIAGSQKHLETEAAHRVFFAFDRYDLSQEARQALQAQAKWLAANPRATITIAGNCDERGTREYNLALGERRANSAKDYLISLGVDASRISTVSYGKERPIAVCSDESCWSKNRNATTAVN